jgi:hypothetical protein
MIPTTGDNRPGRIFLAKPEREHRKREKWGRLASDLLKKELRAKGLRYADLAKLLTADGTPESEANLKNKLSRGTFTAAYLLQCLHVIGSGVIIDE